MNLHNCFRSTWFHNTCLACMISCLFFTPLQKIFDYLPMVLYEMVDSSKLLYDMKLFIFHLLWCWSAFHYYSNAICSFKINSFFSMLELPIVAKLFSEKFLRFLYLTIHYRRAKQKFHKDHSTPLRQLLFSFHEIVSVSTLSTLFHTHPMFICIPMCTQSTILMTLGWNIDSEIGFNYKGHNWVQVNFWLSYLWGNLPRC